MITKVILSLLFILHIQSHTISVIEFDELGVKISFDIIPFNAKRHTISYCETKQIGMVPCEIDGALWYGGDMYSSLPKTEFHAIKVSYKGKEYELDYSSCFNPSFSGKIYKRQVRCHIEGSALYVSALFSDGAGGYMVQWELYNGKSRRLMLTRDERNMW